MERMLCLAYGYLFGLFQTGFIYGKICNVDIRKHGSGNSGATNTLRVLGIKAALVVFLGDALKMVFACLLTRILFADKPEMLYLLLLYAGAGVILGHNFPFYMNFRGGKGIAAMAGIVLSLDPRLALICLVIFVGTVALTRYVSLGSLLISLAFCTGLIYWGSQGDYGLGIRFYTEFFIMAFLITAMAFWRHRANIVRLVHGNENKIGAKKV